MSQFGWSIRLPPCLPLCLFMFPFVGWCVRLPNALSPLSPACLPSCLPSRLPACLPSCFPFLDGLSAFPLVSHCVSFCFVLLDGVSAFPMPCLPCLQLVSHLVYPLVSQLVFLLVFLFWMVYPPSPLSPIVSLFASFCWMVCPPSQCLVSLVSSLSPILSTLSSPSLSSILFSFVGWRVLLPKALSPLFPSLSSSLCLFLFPFVASGLILNFSWCFGNIECTLLAWSRSLGSCGLGGWEWCHLSLSSSDVFITSNLTLLCCLIRVFGSKYSCTSHRMFPSSFFGI